MTTLKRYTGSLWENVGSPTIQNSGPAATLGYFPLTSFSSFTTTEADTGLVVTVVVPEGRRLKITSFIEVQNSLAGANWFAARIYEGATQLGQGVVNLGNNDTNQQYGSVVATTVISPTAG